MSKYSDIKLPEKVRRLREFQRIVAISKIIYFCINMTRNKLSMDRVSGSGMVRSGVNGSGMIRSGSMVGKGSMVSGVNGGRVDGSGMVRSGSRVVGSGMGVFGVFDRVVFADLSFVFDISVVLLVFIDVIVDNLGATIGQLHGVLS